MSPIIAIAFVFVLSLVFTAAVRAGARRCGIVAHPRKDRWHRKPTAMLGGIGIYCAFALGFFLFLDPNEKSYPVLAAATFLFVVGLIDDLVQIKPYTKLSLQLVAAAGIVHFGLKLPWSNYETVNDLVTIFWLVAITNAINLLDNMDGLAGGISLIACIAMAVAFAANGQTQEALLVSMLGAAVLGFLMFNFHPASIFMGDCGSMFLGLTLGSTALLSDYSRTFNLVAVLLTPVLIFLIPILDMCLVTVTRKLSGRPISQGGRDHTSHRLVALGMSERRAVLMLYLLAACSGAMALTVRVINPDVALLLIPAFALTVLFFGLYLGKVRIYENDKPSSGKNFVKIVVEFTHKKRVFEVLLDIVLITLAYYASYLLRFGGELSQREIDVFVSSLPVIVIVQELALLLGGVYRGVWRYTGIADLIVIGRSVGLAGLGSILVGLTMYNIDWPSITVFVLDVIVLCALLCSSRLSFRLLRTLIAGKSGAAHPEARPVFIYGAGDGGEWLIREILNNPQHLYYPVAFIDDDPVKVGKIIHGCRIFPRSDLPELSQRHDVAEVLVSSARVSHARLQEVRRTGLAVKRMRISFETVGMPDEVAMFDSSAGGDAVVHARRRSDCSDTRSPHRPFQFERRL